MALFRFLKTPDPNQYDYKPRFWDPEKERIEKRLADLESRKHEKSADDVKGNLTGSFRGGSRRASKMDYRAEGRAAKKKSNYMLFAIILVLVLLSFIFLNVNLQSVTDFLK